MAQMEPAARLPTFESACADVERSASVVVEAATAITKAARALTRAAHDGDIAKIRTQAERLPGLALTVTAAAGGAADAWPYTSEQEEEYLGDPYVEELRAVAVREQVKIVSLGDRLAVFPSLLRVLPGQRSVRIDRKRITGIRPAKVVNLLKTAQTRKPRTSPEAFLELLRDAYGLVVGKDHIGVGTTLIALYRALTMLPDARRSYELDEFKRDIYLLDSSGVHRTRNGAEMHLSAATATKGSRDLLTVISPEGESHVYYGIRFVEVNDG
jgi:hypothetical protein